MNTILQGCESFTNNLALPLDRFRLLVNMTVPFMGGTICLEKGVERVVITDFGLARAADDVSMTRQGVVAGTPEYMSPEQARGEALDGRSGLFSLGCLLYEMATGVSPFRSDSTIATLRRIVDDLPASMATHVPELPPWFCHIVERLLAKEPAQRFAFASEVSQLLEQCLSHQQQPTTVPLPVGVQALAAQAQPHNNESINLSEKDRLKATLQRRPPTFKLIAVAAFAFSLIFAGVLIVLELNKGTITIHSEADDIPIRIVQGNEIVERFTVNKLGKSVRVSAGSYQVEIEGDFPTVSVVNGVVSLKRGGVEAVSITFKDDPTDGPMLSENIHKSSDLPKFKHVRLTCGSFLECRLR